MINHELPDFSFTENLDSQLGYFFPQEKLPYDLQKASGAVGRVLAKGGNKHQTIGSCSVVEVNRKPFVVSAKHCFLNYKDKLDDRLIILSSGRSFNFNPRMVLNNPRMSGIDILMFPLPNNIKVEPLKLASSLHKEQVVTVVGYPQYYLEAVFSINPVASIGLVTAVTDSVKGVINSIARVEHGNSGGPMLNQASEIVGVITKGGKTYASPLHPEREKVLRVLDTSCLATPIFLAYL